MRKDQQTLADVLSGDRDANLRFDALRQLIAAMGFEERIRGSHHVFHRSDVREIVNLQRDGTLAKVYQVRQVRKLIRRYALHLQMEK